MYVDELIREQTKQQTGEKMTGTGPAPLAQKECWRIHHEAANSPREGQAKEAKD